MKTICGYKGSKRKFAAQIVDRILSLEPSHVYDVCCGSGAITIELVNRGYDPRCITMIDAGPWGFVWQTVGDGDLDVEYVKRMLTEDLPDNPRDVASWVEQDIALQEPSPERFIVLQAASFGATPVWWDGEQWRRGDASANRRYKARSYWEPKPDSKEKKPRGTIFTPDKVAAQTAEVANALFGVDGRCCRAESVEFRDGVIYIDPPYASFTGYGVDIDWRSIVERTSLPVLVSEGEVVEGASKSWELSKKRKAASLTGRATSDAGGEWLHAFHWPRS